jgi:hypothetical protein
MEVTVYSLNNPIRNVQEDILKAPINVTIEKNITVKEEDNECPP